MPHVILCVLFFLYSKEIDLGCSGEDRSRIKMGLRNCSCSSSSSYWVTIILVMNVVVMCNGGKTSSFVRKVEKTVDMPLDSDVFQIPPGYNAPQQVTFLTLSPPFLFLSFNFHTH